MVVDFTRQHFRRRDLDCGFAALSWYTAHFGSYKELLVPSVRRSAS